MDRIWAPWRINYVSRADKEGDCFLCAAAADGDDRESLVVWRGAHCLCIVNRFPYNNGHLMVAPLAHKADLADLDDAEQLAMMHMLRRAELALRATIRPSGFNIGLNLGRTAGAGVPGHLHWHIVPRWDGDTNFMPVVGATKVIAQSLESVWEMLRNTDVPADPA